MKLFPHSHTHSYIYIYICQNTIKHKCLNSYRFPNQEKKEAHINRYILKSGLKYNNNEL